ncbi:hypothetical protein, partial [Prevotella sp. KH2C16]|uniref:hypothetical protein n=1 Tax=Prevotella sp. KH2C16 TaxID=1855325 RepID=UPI0008E59FA5
MERTETGRFAKGLTPRNKGGHKKSRPGMITERGRQGFLPRPVLVINYDGSVKHRFASVGEAQ